MLRRLDRYLISEIVGPVSLGFLIYTGMLLVRFLFESAEMIIQRGLPVSVVGRLLWYSMPSIVVLTIPMAWLFGILIGLGRLASDSELVAMRSCGLSLTRLYRPILALSLVMTAFSALLMIYLLPSGNHALQRLRFEIVTESVARQVEPRVFYPDFQGLLLYVFEVPKGEDRWRGVFVAQALPTRQQNQVTLAEWGRIKLDDAGERVILELENAVTHEVDLGDPERYQISLSRRTERVLQDRFTSTQREELLSSKSLRELGLRELRAVISSPTTDREQRNLARIELHKKFSIPVACLVFGIVALPLGYNNRRGGKGSGFVLSLAVFALYYVLLNNGENAARFGKMSPVVAMWLPNVVLTVAGLLLLFRRNRDKGLLLSRFDRWIRQDLWMKLLGVRRWRQTRETRRRARIRRNAAGVPAELEDGAAASLGPGGNGRAGASTPEVVLRLPRLRLHFIHVFDRYVVRSFATVFLIVTLSALTLYIVADLGDKADDLLKNQVPQGVVLSYFKYLSLQIFYDLAPLIVLVTTLLTFGLLARSNEVTAFKALGISLYRLAVPALAAAGVVVLLCAFLEAEVLPASNQQVAQLRDQILGREASRSYRRADRQWLFGQDRFIYNYLHYDPKGPAIQRLQVFEFDQEHRLAGRLVADRAVYREPGEWIFDDGWIRRFDGVDVTQFRAFDEPTRVDYPETPEYFDSEIRPPDQMAFAELSAYIEELAVSGQKVPELRVDLYRKLAYPAISLVMALVALPFAFRLGRQGALYGIGLSIVLGLVFVAIFAFFTTLGKAGALPPLLAVWSPNLLFAILAGYLFLGVRT